MDIASLMQHPLFQAGLVGFLTAAAVDWQAFRDWKSWDSLTTYNWKLASFRWVQGIVVGVAVSKGLGVQ